MVIFGLCESVYNQLQQWEPSLQALGTSKWAGNRSAQFDTLYADSCEFARMHVGVRTVLKCWEVGWESGLGLGKHAPITPSAGLATWGGRQGFGGV